MRYDTPLRRQHSAWSTRQGQLLTERVEASALSESRPEQAIHQFEVSYLPYGPGDEAGEATCEIVSTYGPVEPEYASLRRECGLLDAPHRTLIELRGSERLDFLDRMLTQKIVGLPSGTVTRSFWLNRKGRIVSDLLVANLEDRTLLELDVHAAEETFASLDAFLFTEDVEMCSLQESHLELRIHGPLALVALSELIDGGEAPSSEGACAATLAGHPVVLFRSDDTGEPGLGLICQREHAEAVWERLLEWSSSEGTRGIRPVGWSAFNAARIEGGTPLFNIDFGPDCLPHETGLLEERVSFEKGCYLGQEIVARVQNLGQPRQILRSLALEGEGLPVSGTQVFAVLDSADGQPHMGPQVGVVTSSTISPMMGAKPIAFAMLKYDYAQAGGRLLLAADGAPELASVRDGLRYLPGQPS